MKARLTPAYYRQMFRRIVATPLSRTALLAAVLLCGVGISAEGPPSTQPAPAPAPAGSPDTRAFGDNHGAKRIVFVCDVGQMDAKWDSFRRELESAIGSLKSEQSFDLILLHAGQPVILAQGRLLAASAANRDQAIQMIEAYGIQEGVADAPFGLDVALRLESDLIYYVTNSPTTPQQKDAILRKIDDLNVDRKTRINTVAYVSRLQADSSDFETLKEIGKDNRGSFRLIVEGE